MNVTIASLIDAVTNKLPVSAEGILNKPLPSPWNSEALIEPVTPNEPETCDEPDTLKEPETVKGFLNVAPVALLSFPILPSSPPVPPVPPLPLP